MEWLYQLLFAFAVFTEALLYLFGVFAIAYGVWYFGKLLIGKLFKKSDGDEKV